MIDKAYVMKKAIHDCFKEMYAKAQPSADWDKIIEDYRNGVYKKDEIIYDRYYLSQEEFIYIKNKYLDAYRLGETWRGHVEIIEKYLEEGGSKDKYIDTYTDEEGLVHPGYRSYDHVLPLKEQIEKTLGDKYILYNPEITKDIVNIVMETIKSCKNFYKFNMDETTFNFRVALGASPTCNKEKVIEYWKSQGKDIKIEERNPLLFWEKDYYGNEFEQIMEEEDGPNWKEIWDKKWKEKQS